MNNGVRTEKAVIQPVTELERPAVTALLHRSSLPLAGLERTRLWGLQASEGLVGVVGYEPCGAAALLRSLAVVLEAQGQGYGRALMDFVLAQVRADGFREAYGLTTTIPDWLLRLGFTETARSDLPEALYASEELRGACPVSARVFVKTLGG